MIAIITGHDWFSNKRTGQGNLVWYGMCSTYNLRKKLLSLNYILSKKKLFLNITKIFLDLFFISVSCITFSGLPDISVV
jgi:hypothetical protein